MDSPKSLGAKVSLSKNNLDKTFTNLGKIHAPDIMDIYRNVQEFFSCHDFRDEG
jgi:hypothetical protein